MREIKFRAWDEDDEIMYYSDKEYEDCFFGFDKGVVVGWLRQTEPQTRDEHAYDYGKPVDVMQFTGLKDKKKDLTELYEGDIIGVDGLLKGNQYENPNLLQEKTNLLIPSITSKDWQAANRQAMERGCRHAE